MAELKEKEMVKAQTGWDEHLNETTVANGLVTGVRCGTITPQGLVEGEVYYKIIGAAFINEEQAAGRHVISVDVVDENFQRVHGAVVYHGWPTQRIPDYDERVQMTVFGSQLAEWGLYANFDAWTVVGPYWVQVAGAKSDYFIGAGLPWKKHVCYAVVFQRTVYHAVVQGTFEEELRAKGEESLLIRFNKDAALQKKLFADGFVPNGNEFPSERSGIVYSAQRAQHLVTGEVRVYYCPISDYNNVKWV